MCSQDLVEVVITDAPVVASAGLKVLGYDVKVRMQCIPVLQVMLMNASLLGMAYYFENHSYSILHG